MSASTSTSTNSARQKKRVRLSSGLKKNRVDVSKSQSPTEVKTAADVHVPNGTVSSSSMVTRSQSKKAQDNGEIEELDSTRKLSVVSIEENSIETC